MFQSNAASFPEIRSFLDKVPVIETHEHYVKHYDTEDPLNFILDNYYHSDFQSAAQCDKDALDAYAGPETTIPMKERYEFFQRIYMKSRHTAYARGMREGLRICYGVDDIDTYEAFTEFSKKFKSRTSDIYERMMETCGIKAKIVDIFDFREFANGKRTDQSKYCRFAFPLPTFHSIHQKEDLMWLQSFLDRAFTCLDDYLEAFDIFLKKSVDFGIVCMKDQSAYQKTLAYTNPSRGDAEKVFNEIIYHPRNLVDGETSRILNDWLFHHALRKAAEYDIPVQLHTGHMAGIRNEIAKTNAAHLIPVMELHQDVKFDLFHGNWPYMDEYLFIGKNYPNAFLNLCWVQSIDPLYCVEFMKRAVMTVPHSKIFAFGGDTGAIEWVAGYLSLCRDNVAVALSELVETDWLKLDEAKSIAADWFFNNPNSFFKLGFPSNGI